MARNNTVTTQFVHGKETVFAQGYRGFINIMVCNGKSIHDGVAMNIDEINTIANRIKDNKNKQDFVSWANIVISGGTN